MAEDIPTASLLLPINRKKSPPHREHYQMPDKSVDLICTYSYPLVMDAKLSYIYRSSFLQIFFPFTKNFTLFSVVQARSYYYDSYSTTSSVGSSIGLFETASAYLPHFAEASSANMMRTVPIFIVL